MPSTQSLLTRAGRSSLGQWGTDQACRLRDAVGHALGLPVFIDRDLTCHAELIAAAGTPRAVFRLTPEELCRMTGGAVEDLKR